MLHLLPLTLDEAYLTACLARAHATGARAVHLSHKLCHHAVDLLEHPEQAREVACFTEAARAAGLEVWCWTHEFSKPPVDYLDDEGRLRCDEPGLATHLAERYAHLCQDILPGLTGIVLTFAECQYPVYQDDRIVSALPRHAHTVRLIDQMRDALAPHGVRLAVRDFVYRVDEVEAMRRAIGGLPDDVVVMSKAVPHDWHPDYPANPLIGACGAREQWVEHDLGFEYEGQHVLPYANLDTMTRRIEHERRSGAAGWCLRLDRYAGHLGFSAISTPWGDAALRVCEAALAGEDPARALSTWEEMHFPGAAAWLREATDCLRQSLFVRGQWYANHSNLPTWGYATSHLSGGNADRLGAWTKNPADMWTEQAMARMPRGWARTLIAEGELQARRAQVLTDQLMSLTSRGPESRSWERGADRLLAWSRCFATHRKAYFLIREGASRPQTVPVRDIDEAIRDLTDACSAAAPLFAETRLEGHRPDRRPPSPTWDKGMDSEDVSEAWHTVIASLCQTAGIKRRTPDRPERDRVECFAVYERAFRHADGAPNPYLEMEADALFVSPSGKQQRLPLFWDGEDIWRFRFAPDEVGEWRWRIDSDDPGLAGNQGDFICTASSRTGGVMVWPDHPHHFRYQNGEPCWLFGDTQWALTNLVAEQDCTTAANRTYAARRAEQGFNLINIKLLAWGVNEGGDVFHRQQIGDDIATDASINPAFWQVADERLHELFDRNLTAFLYLSWFKEADQGCLLSWNKFPNPAARERYARYVIARYSAYNVMWCVGGEWTSERQPLSADGTRQARGMQELGALIRQLDPHQRPVTVHAGGSGSIHEHIAQLDWCAIADNQQCYEHRHRRALAARVHGKPVINGEYGYYLRKCHDGLDGPEGMRTITWEIAMAGAYFVTGWGSTYFGGFRHETPFGPTANPGNASWERQVVHLPSFFGTFAWWRLAPADQLLSGESAYAYCLADAGRQYAVYLRGATGPVTLDLGSGATGAKSLLVQRFDPRTGTWDREPSSSAGEAVVLHCPDEQDWAFAVTEPRLR